MYIVNSFYVKYVHLLKPCKQLLLEYLLLRINKELKSLRLEAKDALLDSKGLLFTSTSSAAAV